MSTLPPEILWKVINGLVYVLGALISIGIGVFVFFHKSILRRLDSIDNDLKPLVTDIALQKQLSNTIIERLHEHERRISKLESK